jgi:hypothetical protein
MSGLRLIAKEDETDFPWERALQALRSLDGLELVPKDFTRMLEVGRGIGWSQELIETNEQLAARGRCFDIAQSVPPELMGSLFEDNIFFSFGSDDHEKICRPTILSLATELDLAVV